MIQVDPIKYCSHCGATVSLKIPDGDNRLRHVCDRCEMIHYQNPKIVTGCIPVWKDRILLCKRAIEPRKGYWTLPAGFLENGETIEEGAARETREEACADLSNQRLYALFNLPHINQVYLMFRADLVSGTGFGIGAESLDVRLFSESQIPWDEIAFKVMYLTLDRYLQERKIGQFHFKSHTVASNRPPRSAS